MRFKSINYPENPYSHSCGGSIIAKDIILTAAHCVIGRVPSQLQIVCGTNYRRGTDGFISPVHEILMHENYDPNTFNNDVALLKLSISIPMNDYTMKPIELSDIMPPSGVMATVTGWGTTSQGGVASTTLQEVQVPIVSNELCDADYGNSISITDTMLCAGFRGVGGKDSCQGDSGGPLVVNGKLTGIVSWGFGCALPEYPGVYANVASLKEWIDKGAAKLME